MRSRTGSNRPGMRTFYALLCLGAATLVRGVQHPFSASTYDAGLFTPLEDLYALSATEHTTLQHPAFPAYGVRIKKSHFCDGQVQ